MSYGTYSGYYPTPLYLGSAYTTVTVTSSGTVDVMTGSLAVAGGTLNAYSVLNLGSIIAGGTTDYGLHLLAGGSVTNGASDSTSAVIEGAQGVLIDGTAASTVVNFATIESESGAGVMVNDGSTITNGASGSTAALIEGRYFGIATGLAAATIANFGTIEGMLSWGVALNGGGSVNNAGLIEGGVYANQDNHAAASSITNAGTIDGDVSDYYGTLTLTNDIGGLIDCSTEEGVAVNDATITNLGTIESTGTSLHYGYYPGGIYLAVHGVIVNGSSTDDSALIGGYAYGINVVGTATITNFGTIESSGREGVKGGDGIVAGFAVEFSSDSSADRLIDEVGASFVGKVTGGGAGVLEFASGSGAGTVSGLGSQFTGFGTIAVDSGAQWEVTGANTLAKGTTLKNAGTLTVGPDAMLDVVKKDVVSGAGTIEVDGGKLKLGVSVASTSLGFTGSGSIALKQHGTYTGITIANIGSGDTIKLDSLAFAAHDTAVYSAGTIELMKKNGAVLASFAATEALGVTGLKVVSAGGKAAIETVPLLPFSVAGISVGGFDRAHAKSSGRDTSALLGSAQPLGSGETEDHARRMAMDLSTGNTEHP